MAWPPVPAGIVLTFVCLLTQLPGATAAEVDIRRYCPWKVRSNTNFVGVSTYSKTGVTNPETCKTDCLRLPNCYTIRYDRMTTTCRFSEHKLYEMAPTYQQTTATDIYYLYCTGTTPAPDNSGLLDKITQNPEYLAMIGMAILIILLVVTSVVIIITLSGRKR